MTKCFKYFVDFTSLTGIVMAATEPIGMEYLEVLKLLFLMILSCLTFSLRYESLLCIHYVINNFCVVGSYLCCTGLFSCGTWDHMWCWWPHAIQMPCICTISPTLISPLAPFLLFWAILSSVPGLLLIG